jgi:hypothetical protein
MTAEQIDRTPIDKSNWGQGPWQTEPDRIEWEHAGRPCLMVRHPRLGHWCGYAAVDPGHTLHGADYNTLHFGGGEDDWWPHGGLTYASLCAHNICHVPKPGEPDDVWWFGFDCAHSGDISPGMRSEYRMNMPYDTYRDAAYVQRETNRLAEYLS